MRDRGPDAAGAVHQGFASLGVARLAITDVERGHQPIAAPSGTSWVGFNGAIYNAASLARRFSLPRASGNDGEVIWPLYDRFGLDFAGHLEGMYAICILDGERSRSVLAVDPIGIKPLYLAIGETGWFAASTLQAFPDAIRGKAFRVPPGTVWSSSGEIVWTRQRTMVDGSLADLLAVSVAEQIPSEVPWGCMLSGGLDSSTIAALAARERPAVQTFASGMPGSRDLSAAAQVAGLLGTDHHEEVIRHDELPELFDAVVAATASPDPFTILAGIGTYAAARAAARSGVKVLLSGEGADELFAGYDDYREKLDQDLEACLVHDQLDLGASECLRLDRCTMAHGIEARVPFLSSSVICKARSLPLTEKLDRSSDPPVHKVALRRVARSILPASIADRPKVGFPDGAALTEAVRELARRTIDERAAAAIERTTGAAGYFRVQRALGVDDRVSALTWRAWSEQFPGLAGSWRELADRGLVRRLFREGQYRPGAWASPGGRRPVALPPDSTGAVCHER